jgi:hypothetical protein
MRITSILAVPTIIFGLATLAACGSASDATPAAAPVTTTAAIAPAAATADYSPIPATPALSSQVDSLDFGTLTKITTSNGIVTLHLDRSHFYLGDAAKAHNKGKTPLDDFILEDTDGHKDYTFTLDPKASLQAEAYLTKNGEGDNLKRETLTEPELVSRMNKITADSDSAPVLVWLRHTDGLDSPVTALVDQFIS